MLNLGWSLPLRRTPSPGKAPPKPGLPKGHLDFIKYIAAAASLCASSTLLEPSQRAWLWWLVKKGRASPPNDLLPDPSLELCMDSPGRWGSHSRF